MKIKNVNSYTQWIVEVNNQEYVRTMYEYGDNKTPVGWHKNFDEDPEFNDVELENKFRELQDSYTVEDEAETEILEVKYS